MGSYQGSGIHCAFSISGELGEYFLGGPGSGHHGHAGRKGKRGGSAPSRSSTLGPILTAPVVEQHLLDKFGEVQVYDILDTISVWITPSGRYAGTEGDHGNAVHSVVTEILGRQWSPGNHLDTEKKLYEMGFARFGALKFPVAVYVGLDISKAPYKMKVAVRDAIAVIDPPEMLRSGDLAGFSWEDKGTGKYGHDRSEFFKMLGVEALSAKESFLSLQEPMTHLASLGREEFARLLLEGDYHFRTDGMRFVVLGGPGSGHFGHAGIPGHRGGSLPRSSAMSIHGADWEDRQRKAKGTSLFGADGYRTTDASGIAGDPEMDVVRNELIQAFTKLDDDYHRLETRFDEIDDSAGEYWTESNRLRDRAAKLELGLEQAKPGENVDDMRLEAKRLQELADKTWAESSEISTQLHALQEIKGRMKQQFTEVDDWTNFNADVPRYSRLSDGTIQLAHDGLQKAGLMVVPRDAFGKYGNDIVVTKVDSGTRAYFDGKICLNDWSTQSTVVHEFGHWLEEKDTNAYTAARGFIKIRTQGETLKPLSQIVPGSNYGWSEKAKPDKFVHAYVGKHYDHNATEVISMGLEQMFNDPAGFARKDPMHFDLIFAVMHNEYGGAFMQNLISEGTQRGASW